jgi:hypothetical protein
VHASSSSEADDDMTPVATLEGMNEAGESAQERPSGTGIEKTCRSAETTEISAELEEAYKELKKWVDISSVEYVELYARRELAKGRPGNAIKVRVGECFMHMCQ